MQEPFMPSGVSLENLARIVVDKYRFHSLTRGGQFSVSVNACLQQFVTDSLLERPTDESLRFLLVPTYKREGSAMLRILASVLLMSVLSRTQTAADVARWKHEAERGDAKAQFWLGVAYETGKGAKRDFAQARKWFGESAKQGNQDAQNMLGQMYEDAEGVAQDYAQAAKWYLAACEHRFDGGGAGQGCNNLGLLYLDGHGVNLSRVEAYKYFKLAGSEDNLETVKSGMSASELAEAESQTQRWLRVHRGE